MSRLIDAMKQKFGTPANAMRALGIDPALLGGNGQDRSFLVELADGPAMKFAADSAARTGEYQMARFTRSRRYAYDDAEEAAQELLDVVKDPDSSFSEQLAALVEHAAERDPEGGLRGIQGNR